MNSGAVSAICLAKELKAKIIILPSPDNLKVDPNSYFASGHTREVFIKLKNQAKTVAEVMVSAIPQDLPKIELREALKEVFEYLLTLDELDATNHLRYTVKEHFSLSSSELDDYIKYFKSLAKREKTEQIKKEELKELANTSYLETNEFIAEEIYNPSSEIKFQFCILNKITEAVTYDTQIESDGIIYLPNDSEEVKKNFIRLPSSVIFVTDEEIDNKIDEFISSYVWMDEKARFFAKLYIKYSWIYDRYTIVPYLRPSGPPGSGKTRYNDAVGALCNKPLITSGGISEAVLFRIIDEYGPTLVINEFDKLNSDEKSLFAIILNNGFEKGKPVPRMVGEGAGMHYKFFRVFSPKIFATRDKFQDTALESRIIALDSKEFPRDKRNNYPVLLSEGFWEWSTEVRNLLLGYRFKYIASLERARKQALSNLGNQPDSQQLKQMRVSESGLPDRSDLEKQFLAIDEFEARTRQTFYPLLFVLRENEFEQFISYVKEYQSELIEKRGEELEGIIARKIIELYNADSEGKVSTSDLRKKVNEELTGEKEISPQKLGGQLRRLKIKTKPEGHDNIPYLIIDPDLIASFKKKYLPTEETNHANSQQAENMRASQRNEATTDSTPSSQEARNTTSIAQELKPCYVCGFINYWKRKDGGIVCAVCHPPIEEQE